MINQWVLLRNVELHELTERNKENRKCKLVLDTNQQVTQTTILIQNNYGRQKVGEGVSSVKEMPKRLWSAFGEIWKVWYIVKSSSRRTSTPINEAPSYSYNKFCQSHTSRDRMGSSSASGVLSGSCVDGLSTFSLAIEQNVRWYFRQPWKPQKVAH